MKKKRLLLLLLLMLGIGVAHADETPQDGIFVWTSGSATCYQLESHPKVSYRDVGGVTNAVLTLQGKTEPELMLPLKDGATLRIAYGIYSDISSPSDREAPAEVRKSGKYIVGGRLVIIRDGKHYNIDGTIIK